MGSALIFALIDPLDVAIFGQVPTSRTGFFVATQQTRPAQAGKIAACHHVEQGATGVSWMHCMSW
ncbi:inner membrane protein [Bordetella pertussis]|nr:inner membrane protein [Bordetella pertussis]